VSKSPSQAYHLYRWFWNGLDLLYPPVCGGCGRAGLRWCEDCCHKAVTLPEPLCELCGLPRRTSGVCTACRSAPPPYRALRSWLVFEGPFRKALHRLKYRRDVGLGDALAALLAEYASGLNWPVDLITPVPLSKKRLQERGYNQVALIARPLSLALGWRYTPRALARLRETASQVGLSAEERRKNVSGAFKADASRVGGRTILLVDDIATTGATLAACAQALLVAGASDVYALTAARALPRHGLKDV